MQTPSQPTTGSESLTAGRFTKEQLQNMPIAELQRLASKLGIGTGGWRQCARKAVLIDSILAGRPIDEQQGTPASTGGNTDAAAKAVTEALAAMLASVAGKVDESKVIELIQQHAPKIEPSTIRIQMDNLPEREIGRQHFKFPLLLACARARVPAYLVGPAGTGKTSAAFAAAESIGQPFGTISVGPMTSKSDLFGMRDAHGNYHETDLMSRAKQGGVFLFDEFDAGNAGVLTSVNMLLANGYFAAPDGMHQKSDDFIPMFALNTYGNGASRVYVGRNPLDGATLDRGAMIDWPTDEGLEASFIGVNQASPSFDLAAGGVPSPEGWLSAVRAFRSRCEALALRHVVSPRAVIFGVKLAAAGVGVNHLKEILLFKGMDKDTRAKVAA